MSQREGSSFLLGARAPSGPSLELPGLRRPPTSGELNHPECSLALLRCTDQAEGLYVRAWQGLGSRGERSAPRLGGDLVVLRNACWPQPPKPTPLMRPTWVLAASTPLDETDDEQDQYQQGDGAHEPDEPALGSDVCLVVGVSWWGRARSKHMNDFSREEGRRER